MHDVYRAMLEKHGIPYNPARVLETITSIGDGRRLIGRFAAAGVLENAQAVICVHDVLAIGLCLEAEDRGIRVPEDLRVCSLNYSQNSLIFQPDITGIDRMDEKAAEMACDLLERLIAGESIPRVNNYEGAIRYGYSCGHPTEQPLHPQRKQALQLQALTKIQMGSQISRMMQFNDSLEKAETPDDWADSMYATLQDLGCRGFYCCLNQTDIPFIASNREDHKTEASEAYDGTMTVIAGFSPRTDEMRNVSFPLEQLVPVQPEAGDQFLVLPVHHANRSYGYMVFLNDDLPIEQYTFRIFQESLGNSIENLHNKMILKSNIAELDRLHMEDQLTGLNNRFGLKRFSSVFPEGTPYTVVMIDMDGLKKINDAYGHQAGNNAICMIAEALKEIAEPGDLVIRYGGDEFLVISHNTDPLRWEKSKETLNSRLEAGAAKQRLPYPVSVSVGYAISDTGAADLLKSVIARADQQMYANKKERALQ
jgi:diguanylate cyclase (GGDEF)-like protein